MFIYDNDVEKNPGTQSIYMRRCYLQTNTEWCDQHNHFTINKTLHTSLKPIITVDINLPAYLKTELYYKTHW